MVYFHKALQVLSKARSDHSDCWSHTSALLLVTSISSFIPLSCVLAHLCRSREENQLEMNCHITSFAFDPTSHESRGSEAKECITHSPASCTSSNVFCISFHFAPKSHRSDADGPRLMPTHAVGAVNRRGTLGLGILYLSSLSFSKYICTLLWSETLPLSFKSVHYANANIQERQFRTEGHQCLLARHAETPATHGEFCLNLDLLTLQEACVTSVSVHKLTSGLGCLSFLGRQRRSWLFKRTLMNLFLEKANTG